MLAVMMSAVASLLTGAARAADMGVPESAAVAPAGCGPCGCLTVTYVRHRELRSTYGTGFDPRNFDETEPHYYFGPMRTYPRYYVNGVPVPHQCEP